MKHTTLSLLTVAGLIAGMIFHPVMASAKSKTYAGQGALIGAGSGLGLGLAVGGPFMFDSCKNSDDVGDCQAIRSAFRVGGLIALPLLGAGIGSLIGVMIKRDKEITVTPDAGVDSSGNPFGGLRLKAQF